MPATVFPPTLRQAGGRQMWVPIGFRGRGAPGSGGAYDTTNTSVMDQTVWQAPSFAGVKAIKLVYAGFDITSLGEVDRTSAAGAAQPATSFAASVMTIGRSNALTWAGTTIASGSTTITLTPSNGGTPWSTAKVGQFVSASNGAIPSLTYVTNVNTTYNSSGVPTALTITLSAATTASIASGVQISFVGDLSVASFGGVRNSRLEARHGLTVSDPLPVQLAANQMFAVRTYAAFGAAGFQIADTPSPASGSSRILASDNALQYEFSTRGTAITDATQNNVMSSNSGGGYFCPLFILGLLDAPAPASVLILGDSIGAGTGDAPDTYANARRMGFIQKSLSNGVPWISLARGSTTAIEMLNGGGIGAYACAIETGVTDVLLQLCRNDIFATGLSASFVISMLQTIAAPYIALGARVWVFTCPPYTTSSDGWVTTANQAYASGGTFTLSSAITAGQTTLPVTSVTGLAVGQAVSGPLLTGLVTITAVGGSSVTLSSGPSGGVSSGSVFAWSVAEIQRQSYNATLRAGVASLGFAGLIDYAVLVEDTVTPGKWAVLSGGVAGTADGIHPSPANHTAIVSAGVIKAGLFSQVLSTVQ